MGTSLLHLSVIKKVPADQYLHHAGFLNPPLLLVLHLGCDYSVQQTVGATAVYNIIDENRSC